MAQAGPEWSQSGVLHKEDFWAVPTSSTEGSSLASLLPPPTGVERQTAEEKAFGDFVINRPDTPYGMMNFTYEPQDFDRLVALSRYNILNNVETLKCALQLALDRHQAQERAGD